MSRNVALALLVLRGMLGAVFVAHGGQKLFGWFGGDGFAAEVTSMRELGLEPATLMALAAGTSELAGGILVLIGLLTPLGALAITGVMIGAIAVDAWPNGFFVYNGGFEYNLVLIAICAALALTGAGHYSVDRVLLSTSPGKRLFQAALGRRHPRPRGSGAERRDAVRQ